LRAEEAIEMLEQAVTHFGHNVAAIRGDLAISQIIAGRLDDAEETLATTLELFPKGHYLPYVHLATLNEARGNIAEAVAAIEQVPITAGESTLTVGLRYFFIGRSGDRETARLGYEQLLSTNQSGSAFIPASQLAMAAYGAGNHDAAVSLLTKSAIVERDPIINWTAILPFNRHLYYHKGFRSLVTDTMKLKLSPLFLP
jgi:tetratricopeptide (TPR) repeat protein